MGFGQTTSEFIINSSGSQARQSIYVFWSARQEDNGEVHSCIWGSWKSQLSWLGELAKPTLSRSSAHGPFPSPPPLKCHFLHPGSKCNDPIIFSSRLNDRNMMDEFIMHFRLDNFGWQQLLSARGQKQGLGPLKWISSIYFAKQNAHWCKQIYACIPYMYNYMSTCSRPLSKRTLSLVLKRVWNVWHKWFSQGLKPQGQSSFNFWLLRNFN